MISRSMLYRRRRRRRYPWVRSQEHIISPHADKLRAAAFGGHECQPFPVLIGRRTPAEAQQYLDAHADRLAQLLPDPVARAAFIERAVQRAGEQPDRYTPASSTGPADTDYGVPADFYE